MTKEYIVSITDVVLPDGFERFENEYSPEQELVRCKDCKYYQPYIFDDFDVLGNPRSNACVLLIDLVDHGGDWFCADGKRR